MKKTSQLGSNIVLVKTHNLQAILLTLLHETNLSRVELAHQTGLSNTTITNLIGELLEQGIVAEDCARELTGPRSVGRPRTALQLLPNARFAIGVHVGIGLFRIAITNLRAEIVYGAIHHFDLLTPAYQVLDAIAAAVETAIQESKLKRQFILGVGVGASGLVSEESGVNIVSPRLGWENIPIQAWLCSRLNLPVVVDNNVRAMALGEAFFGVGQGVSSLAFVYGRVGVGAGFVFDGKIFRGNRSGAGEIGHMVMVSESGQLCQCGKRGCLETLVSEPVLVKQSQAYAQEHPTSLLAKHLRQSGPTQPLEGVLAAARAGDGASRELIERQAYYLGIALANLVNLLNPELILLGGMFAQAGDLFLPAATETLRKNAFAGLGGTSRLELSGFGWRAGVIGAASLPLARFFYSPDAVNSPDGLYPPDALNPPSAVPGPAI